MRPTLEIREFPHRYQQKLQLTFASEEIIKRQNQAIRENQQSL